MSEELLQKEVETTPVPQEAPAAEESVKLDAPLVVHKKSDASYKDSTEQYEMTETHTEDGEPLLERHRFKKEKKKGSARPVLILLAIALVCSVFAGLYYSGKITFDNYKVTKKTTVVTESTTKDLLSEYRNTIVVKDTYIFVHGKEVNGIEGLQSEIKYDDPSPTAYEIILENENTDFYNFEVLPILTDLGFYDKTTKVTHLDKTGLTAAAEATANESTTAS